MTWGNVERWECSGREVVTDGFCPHAPRSQIGVFAAYASTAGRALVDRELYLPKSWTDDRDRCRAAKVPDEREFATKNTLAATIVRRALASPLPVAWVTADAAYGQDNRFRRMLEHPASATSSPSPSPSSPWPAHASTRPSSRPPTRHGNAVPVARARRDSANTTGQPSSCAQCPSTTTRTAC
ncbi:transposase [Streptomyces europaeiscabiei]|uniref:transposase n=1 Tax=Streptomyces europaeiscabiei TaxID=146819 RepID=UPI0039A4B88D